MSLDRSLSAKRKVGAKPAIKCRLKPRLEHVLLWDLTAAVLDRELIAPCQQELSLPYVRRLFVLLVVEFLQASMLALIDKPDGRDEVRGPHECADHARGCPVAWRLLAEVVPMLAGLFVSQPGKAIGTDDAVPRHSWRRNQNGTLVRHFPSSVGDCRVPAWAVGTMEN
ncbi:hypothetical protein [Pseudomonas sp.]|jgi:hypothetical protein|uniref:hypothetical protein n=1 Tax=Pseudomonas sp. TaxID=306 RepID=UPI002ED80A2E